MSKLYDRDGNIRYRGGISYPEAYEIRRSRLEPLFEDNKIDIKNITQKEIDKIKPKIVKASAHRETNRPDTKKNIYLCPGCLAPVHWVKGSRRQVQGKDATVQPNYGKPFFRHNPNTLDRHLSLAAPILVADLAVVINNIAVANSWGYENLETYSSTARKILLTNNNLKNPIKLEFVIAPNRTTKIPDDFNGVVVTTSGQMTENHRSLLLVDDNSVALTAEKLHGYLHGFDRDSNAALHIKVSGILAPETMPRPDSDIRGELLVSKYRHPFIHQPRNLVNAMLNIMEDQYRFVEHVDIVPDYYLPTRQRYGITDRSHEKSMQNLVDQYRFVLDREFLSMFIADRYDYLSRGSDNNKSRARGGRYRYGKADFVTFTRYTQGRDDQLVAPGAKKVLINPEPWNLPNYFRREDWENTLIVFYRAEALRKQYLKSNHFQEFLKLESSSIASGHGIKRLERNIIEFLGRIHEPGSSSRMREMQLEIDGRIHYADIAAEQKPPVDIDKANIPESKKRKDWDSKKNFLDWETGVAQERRGDSPYPENIDPGDPQLPFDDR